MIELKIKVWMFFYYKTHLINNLYKSFNYLKVNIKLIKLQLIKIFIIFY